MTANTAPQPLPGAAEVKSQLSQLSDLLEQLRKDIEPLHLARKKRFETLQALIQQFESTTQKIQPPSTEARKAEGSGAKASASSPSTASRASAKPCLDHVKRRDRTKGPPPSCRASKYSKVEQIRKVFDDIAEGDAQPTTLQLQLYICDFLGFGVSEALALCERVRAEEDTVPFERFQVEYPLLNPYTVTGRSSEVIVRKPGSVSDQRVVLEELQDCEAYICDKLDCADACELKRCLVLIGPCAGPVQVRDCEDCVFWVACQQFRTWQTKRCTFHIYSKTYPTIERSDELTFAPWTAQYPGCTEHFKASDFDAQHNLWNSLYDFNGEAGRAHWRICPLEEIVDLRVELDEPPSLAVEPSTPAAPATHEQLCEEPKAIEESAGNAMHNAPQTRPPLPPAPGPGGRPRQLLASDAGASGAAVGLRRL